MLELNILVGFRPRRPRSNTLVIDWLTRRITEGSRLGTDGLFPNEEIICCGEPMLIRNTRLVGDGITFCMPACVIHLAAYHREEALEFNPDLAERVAQLPKPGIPTVWELSGRHR